MDGILIINKHKGCTSHDIVYKVKKICNQKVGHTGTLDPLATGVLPLLIGKGTLCSKYLINHDKTYVVTLKLGQKTDTADGEGSVIETKNVDDEILNIKNVKKILKECIGKQEQIPPIYSAIKVNGKKLYEYARKGQKVEIMPRTIEIYSIDLEGINNQEQEIKFKVSCSKGTYIRSLCEDMAKKLGTIGYMKELNRIQVGNFLINQAITVEQLECNKNDENFFCSHLITIEQLFKNSDCIIVDDRIQGLLLNGVKLSRKENDGVYRIYNNNKTFVGIGTIKKGLLKRDIII